MNIAFGLTEMFKAFLVKELIENIFQHALVTNRREKLDEKCIYNLSSQR
ncbi:hypothetical protein KUL156_61130 [Alteromonas sp. KUL156]|nr:hypothetical protein KUL118_67730 [Tenacibaculum sp. KUL118]GFD94470.1 hypothetical protein KUL154_32030 [Alteromonas sp. KUL154]GFE03521.1 hypothetical protein KUL156_61130 [Alteromonas sp. KUL156]